MVAVPLVAAIAVSFAEMLNGSTSINLQPDDWVFLRPSQSEHVFLQFGDIAVYEDGEIVDSWPVFSQGA